jgi:hypothetical protein
MTKLILIILMAFCIYTFVSINAQAKAEIVRTTIDIPVKIGQVIAKITNSVDEARNISEVK